MLLKENGPFGIFESIRSKLGVEEGSYKYEITVCHYCLSVWVALILFFVPWQVNAVFAASAAVIFIEKWHNGSSKN